MRNLRRSAVAVATLAWASACAPISNKTAPATADKCSKDVLDAIYPGA